MIELLALPFLLFLLGGAGTVGYLFGSARNTPDRALVKRLHELVRQHANAVAIDDMIEANRLQRQIVVVKETLDEIRGVPPL